MHDVVDETINITFIEACEARKLVSGTGAGAEWFWVRAIVAVKFLWWEVGLMNDTMDVILVNRRNKSDDFRTVLPAKMCVRVWGVFISASSL